MRRHRHFIFEKYHVKIQVYETNTRRYPRVDHPEIQPQKFSTQRSCIYGNPKGDVWTTQSVKIANGKLKLHLAKFGYEPSIITLGLWRHRTRPLQFSLVVDNFGVKYERQEEINHILHAQKK